MKERTIQFFEREDTRLVGRTAENLFLSLLNQQGIFAASFDVQGFDGIAFDHFHRYFKVGEPPYYFQIKCRGSKSQSYNSQGHKPEKIENIRIVAQQFNIQEKSVYFIVGFFKNNDIRTLTFFGVPFGSLPIFKVGDQFRFSVDRCKAATKSDKYIFQL
ncbi:MAG: hypothetical protein AB1410_10630 [Acidobacteriota bacterium]